jgi:hypothetical protein
MQNIVVEESNSGKHVYGVTVCYLQENVRQNFVDGYNSYVNNEPFKYDSHPEYNYASVYETGRYYAAELKYLKHIPICVISADDIPPYVDALAIEKYHERLNKQNAKDS